MKCGQHGCEKDATQIVYWPGQTTYQCDEDTQRVKSMGLIMGIRVDSSPIEVKDATQINDAGEDTSDSGVPE